MNRILNNLTSLWVMIFCLGLTGCFGSSKSEYEKYFAIAEQDGIMLKFTADKSFTMFYKFEHGEWKMDMSAVLAVERKENMLGIRTPAYFAVFKKLGENLMSICISNYKDDNIDPASAKLALERFMSTPNLPFFALKPYSGNMEPINGLIKAFNDYGGKWIDKKNPENAIIDIEPEKLLCLFMQPEIASIVGSKEARIMRYEGSTMDNGWKNAEIAIGNDCVLRTSRHGGPLWISDLFIATRSADKSRVYQIIPQMSEADIKAREEKAAAEIKKQEELEKAERAKQEELQKKAEAERIAEEAKRAEEDRIAKEKALAQAAADRKKIPAITFGGINLADSPMKVIKDNLQDYEIATTFPIKQEGNLIKGLEPLKMSDVQLKPELAESMKDFLKHHEHFFNPGQFGFQNGGYSYNFSPNNYSETTGISLDSIFMKEKDGGKGRPTKIWIYYYKLPGGEPKMLMFSVAGDILSDVYNVFNKRYGHPEATYDDDFLRQYLWRNNDEAAILTLARNRGGSLDVISQKGYDEYFDAYRKMREEAKRLEQEKIEKEKTRLEERKSKI